MKQLCRGKRQKKGNTATMNIQRIVFHYCDIPLYYYRFVNTLTRKIYDEVSNTRFIRENIGFFDTLPSFK